MKLTFLKIKVYKKNFLIYISVLATVCVIFMISIIAGVSSNIISTNKSKTEEAYNKIEKNINDFNNNIESYIQSLYSNKDLLNDFLFYLGNDPETYYTKKLVYSDYNSYNFSFINYCKSFISQNNTKIVQINFTTNYITNSVTYSPEQGFKYFFKQDENDVVKNTKLPEFYYIYEKNLPSPVNVARKMGKVQFIIDLSSFVSSVDNYNFSYAYLTNRNNILPLTKKSQDNNYSQIRQVYDSNLESQSKRNVFNQKHYHIKTSNTYNYSLITIIDDIGIITTYPLAFFLLIIAFILVFIIMSVLIASRMNYDAEYLLNMLDFITEFEKGNFEQSKIMQRNDEYSMIANALNGMSDKIKLYIRQEYMLKIKQQQAEMKALENQINPHFLYNTLEIIRSKAYLNGDEVVANALFNLGSIYRNMVKGEQIITINEEIEMLRQYLKLMEFKYENNFYYQIDFPQSMLDLKTIKFWMQPLVENFFSHGFNKDDMYNLILIMGEENENEYIIEIIDNGKGMDESTLNKINYYLTANEEILLTEHIGLRNVYLRLRYFYGEKIKMVVENNQEAGVTIRIKIEKEEGF